MSRFSFFFLSIHFHQLCFVQLSLICALHPTAPSTVGEFSVTLNPFWQRQHIMYGCMAVYIEESSNQIAVSLRTTLNLWNTSFIQEILQSWVPYSYNEHPVRPNAI